MLPDLVIGVVLVALSAALLYLGIPDKNGEPPPFLRFEAALVLYPPIIMAAFVLGAAELISVYFGIRQ